MAGIFSDVSTDIQKLRQLKAEIENVKKSLKGIDVNVNIDIAKGMEAKFQSLMKQYDALVKKVSEAEGKIMISTKRINDASEKIIKAQEQLSKAAGMNIQPSNGNADVSLNNVGTANVQAQAKAYDELAEEIDSVMGTRSQNIKRMIDEQNAIRLINEEIKKLTKLQTGNSTLTNTQQKRLEQLNNSLLTHKAALSDVRQTLMNNVKLDNSAITSMNGLSQSLSRMRIAYRELTEEERNSPFGKELLASIQQADAKIKELDATIGNHQRNVGNYVKGYNGLNMSVQQIVRELPSAAMGLNMFFLAISNNLPILTDEIKRAKAANEELKVSGQKGVPVWKQVASSLFSWQSALMVGITLLTVHGDKVWEWISSLFKAKDTATSLSGVTSELNKSMSENNTGYGKNIATLNKLQSKWKELDGDLSKQKTFIYENKDAFSELGVSINDVNDAEKILSDNTGKFIKTLDLRAKAAAAYQLAIKKVEEAFQHGIAADEILNGGANFWDYWNAGIDVLGNLDWVIQGGDVWNPEKFTQGRAGKELIASDKANSQFQMLMQLSEQFAEKRKESLKQMGLTDDDMNLVSGSIEAIEAAISAKREALKKVTNRKDYIKIESEIKTEEAKLKAITGNTTKEQQEKERQKKEQEQLAEELLQLRLKNQQEEINLMDEGSEKKRRQIELDYQKEIDAYNKAKAKYGEIDEVKVMKSNAESKRNKSFYEVDIESLQAEKDALNSYLQEYGTFQQRKYAIAQEYADKIAKAQTNAEKIRLGKERDSKLSGIESNALKANIDWVTVFGEFGGMFSNMIKPALEDARKYMQTDEFKNSDASSQQAIVDAVNQMEKSLGGAGGLDFKKLGDNVQAYQNSVVSLNLAKEQEADALERLVTAQEEYENALKNGTEEQKNAAKEALANAQSNADLASANVQMQSENVEKAQKGMSETATALKANMDNVVQGLQQITSGGLTNIYNGLIQAGKGVGGAAGKLADSLESVPVVGWILSIIDIFKDGISIVISGLLDSVFSAVSGIIEDVLSGDLFVSIGESLMKGIGSIFDAISFGGFSKLTSIGSNAKEVQEAIDRLTDRNEALQGSIDALNDTIKAGRGAISVNAARKAVKYQDEQNANYLKIAQEQARYSGNHHSWNYYWGGFTQSQINDFSNQIGRNWNGSLWDLSPEEMKLLKGNVDMWAQIQNTGKGGYGGRLTEKLDDYIEQAGKIEELETQLNESLTGMTFDSMYDSFIDTLMDMDASAEDFADNMSEYFMRAMLSNKIGELYYDRLNEWYEDFAKRMEDGTLDDNELNYLQGKWNGIVSDAIKERDDIASAVGYDNKKAQGQQSASSRGFGTEMTHEDAGELSGRFTAVYESNLRIETAEQQQTIAITELRGSIGSLTSQVTGLYNIADETRTILANSYLELQQIRENTGEIVKPIKQMQADIAEVKRNTARL